MPDLTPHATVRCPGCDHTIDSHSAAGCGVAGGVVWPCPCSMQPDGIASRLVDQTTAELRARVAELEAGRDQIAEILTRHRGTSTRLGVGGAYKNPVREGYDRGLTEALAALGVDAKEKTDA